MVASLESLGEFMDIPDAIISLLCLVLKHHFQTMLQIRLLPRTDLVTKGLECFWIEYLLSHHWPWPALVTLHHVKQIWTLPWAAKWRDCSEYINHGRCSSSLRCVDDTDKFCHRQVAWVTFLGFVHYLCHICHRASLHWKQSKLSGENFSNSVYREHESVFFWCLITVDLRCTNYCDVNIFERNGISFLLCCNFLY